MQPNDSNPDNISNGKKPCISCGNFIDESNPRVYCESCIALDLAPLVNVELAETEVPSVDLWCLEKARSVDIPQSIEATMNRRQSWQVTVFVMIIASWIACYKLNPRLLYPAGILIFALSMSLNAIFRAQITQLTAKFVFESATDAKVQFEPRSKFATVMLIFGILLVSVIIIEITKLITLLSLGPVLAKVLPAKGLLKPKTFNTILSYYCFYRLFNGFLPICLNGELALNPDRNFLSAFFTSLSRFARHRKFISKSQRSLMKIKSAAETAPADFESQFGMELRIVLSYLKLRYLVKEPFEVPERIEN